METKINLGLALSKNFQKVTVEMSDELIEYESDNELKAKIRQKLKLIREEVQLELDRHTGGNQ